MVSIYYELKLLIGKVNVFGGAMHMTRGCIGEEGGGVTHLFILQDVKTLKLHTDGKGEEVMGRGGVIHNTTGAWLT